jgi:hypothetical protein
MDLSKVKRYLVTSLTNQYIFLIKTSHINIENFLILIHVFKVKMCMFLVKLAGSEKGNCSWSLQKSRHKTFRSFCFRWCTMWYFSSSGIHSIKILFQNHIRFIIYSCSYVTLICVNTCSFLWVPIWG